MGSYGLVELFECIPSCWPVVVTVGGSLVSGTGSIAMVLVALKAGTPLGKCEEVDLVSQPSEANIALGTCKVKAMEMNRLRNQERKKVPDHLVDVMVEWREFD